jgi:hypothetical protein
MRQNLTGQRKLANVETNTLPAASCIPQLARCEIRAKLRFSSELAVVSLTVCDGEIHSDPLYAGLTSRMDLKLSH